MTYNIHGGVGIDGKLAVERIAKVIARLNPDVAALQEVDVGKERSGRVDQAELIARHLEMNFHFHPAMHVEDEKYGDAILTHHPVRLIKADSLPGHILPGRKSVRKRERRGAIWVVVEINGLSVNIINTHLGLSPQERGLQIEELLGKNWLGHPDCKGPVILCGDFNAVASSSVCRRLREQLRDVQKNLPGHRPRATFYSRMPVARIDHIFVSEGIQVISIEVPRNQLTLMASDHLPLVTDLRIEETPLQADEEGQGQQDDSRQHQGEKTGYKVGEDHQGQTGDKCHGITLPFPVNEISHANGAKQN